MSTYQFANNAATTLGSAITSTATSITVANGTGAKFPNPGAGQYFTATLFSSPTGQPNEIVRVTARTGDTLTVLRGQEGSTAQAWAVGDTFSNLITAGFLNQLVDSRSLQAQSCNFAQDTGTANAANIMLLPAPTSSAALLGVPIRVLKQGATNTGNFTLTVNGLTYNVLLGGLACEGGEIVGNNIFEVIFDGNNFNLISNPGTLHGDRLTANSVPNAALAVMSALTVKGNVSNAPNAPTDVSMADLVVHLGIGGITANANGYFFNIGNTIVQFGYKGTSGDTFSFPFVFPTGCLLFLASNANSMGQFVDVAFGYSVSPAQFYLATKASNDSRITAYPCFWMAIGN